MYRRRSDGLNLKSCDLQITSVVLPLQYVKYQAALLLTLNFWIYVLAQTGMRNLRV